MSVLVVLTNCPDAACAERIAQAAIDAGLAACANIMAPCRSVYRWQGKVESAEEIPLILKSTAGNYPELEKTIRRLHPYELPEIIALPVEQGLPAYLEWVELSVIDS